MSDNMQLNTIPAQWREWLLTNIQRNCSNNSMLEAMLQAQVPSSQAQA